MTKRNRHILVAKLSSFFLAFSLILFLNPLALKASATATTTTGPLAASIIGGTVTFVDATNYSYFDGTTTVTGTYDQYCSIVSTGALILSLTNTVPVTVENIDVTGQDLTISGTGTLIIDASADPTITNSVKCANCTVTGGDTTAINTNTGGSATAMNISQALTVNGGNLTGNSDYIGIHVMQDITVANGTLTGKSGGLAAIRTMAGGNIIANAGGTIIGDSTGSYGVVTYVGGNITVNLGGEIRGYGNDATTGACGVAATGGNINVVGGTLTGYAFDIGVEAGTNLQSSTQTPATISVSAGGTINAIGNTNLPTSTVIGATTMPITVTGGSVVHSVYQTATPIQLSETAVTTIPIGTIMDPTLYTWYQSSDYAINSTGGFTALTPQTVWQLDGTFNPLTAAKVSTNATSTVDLLSKQNAGNIEVRAVRDGSVAEAGASISLASAADTYTIDFNVNAVSSSVISSIKFLMHPSNGTVGKALKPFTVQALNAAGNPVSGVTVTLTGAPFSLAANATVKAAGGSAITNASGIAQFSSKIITAPGTYTLTATSGGVSGTSNSFIITGVNPKTGDNNKTKGMAIFVFGLSLIAVSASLKKRKTI